MMMMMSRNFEIRCGVNFQVAEEEADGELHLQRHNIKHDVRTTSSRYNFSNENKIASREQYRDVRDGSLFFVSTGNFFCLEEK